MKGSSSVVAGISILVLAACGGSAPAPTPPSAGPPAGAPAAAGDDGEAQAARGAPLFAANCASCHGDAGQGSHGAPPLVGKAALPLDPPAGAKFRKAQFHTALDVAGFVVKNMPPQKGGSLKESEYWDILAFDLKANGLPVAGKHVDATTAALVKLH